MQPVQLSLMPDPPSAPPTPAGALPGEAIEAATALLAGVITKAAVPAGIEVAGDE